MQVWQSFFVANAIVRAKQEDQPKPLAVGAPVCSTSAHAGGAVTAVTAVTACPRPVPAGAGRALPAAWPAQCARGCTVRACSPAMPILHITFVFSTLRDCRMPSAPLHPARRFHGHTCPPAPACGVCCARALAEPSSAVQSHNCSPLPPPSLSRLQACVTTPPSP